MAHINTNISQYLINAIILRNTKLKKSKVFKRQIFALRKLKDSNYHNKYIRDHLIGNIYYDALTSKIIEIYKENNICRQTPMYLTKYSFKHEAPKKTRKIKRYEKNVIRLSKVRRNFA